MQNLMNEAAILAARRELKEISKDEISDDLDKIIAAQRSLLRIMVTNINYSFRFFRGFF